MMRRLRLVGKVLRIASRGVRWRDKIVCLLLVLPQECAVAKRLASAALSRLARGPLIGLKVRHLSGRCLTLEFRAGNSADYFIVSEFLHGSYCPPGGASHILDCGANIGCFALHAAALFPDASLECYEPDQENFRLLTANLRNNGIRGRCLRKGVWGSSISGFFHRKTSFDGYIDQNQSDCPIECELPAVAESTWVKMDIEGAEYEALPAMLRSPIMPHWISLEIHDFASRGRLLLDLLRSHGFALDVMTDGSGRPMCAEVTARRLPRGGLGPGVPAAADGDRRVAGAREVANLMPMVSTPHDAASRAIGCGISARDEGVTCIQRIPGMAWRAVGRRWHGNEARSGCGSFWRDHALWCAEAVHREISDAIGCGRPCAAGRLGGFEANIVLWAKGLPVSVAGRGRLVHYWETGPGSANAGIRPRNRESYRAYAKLAAAALRDLDCLAVWRDDYEAAVFSRCGVTAKFVDGEHLAPTMRIADHWMIALGKDRRVLVVTPFAKTMAEQVPKLPAVWRGRPCPEATFSFVPFPYLIEESCPERWWDVHARIAERLMEDDYDVALFGCGGLGLPLAAVAKTAGKVGLHLGGHCQLLFGIYGRRHLQQEWHRSWINEAWTRPLPDEVPPSAMKVEGGCYW